MKPRLRECNFEIRRPMGKRNCILPTSILCRKAATPGLKASHHAADPTKTLMKVEANAANTFCPVSGDASVHGVGSCRTDPGDQTEDASMDDRSPDA